MTLRNPEELFDEECLVHFSRYNVVAELLKLVVELSYHSVGIRARDADSFGNLIYSQQFVVCHDSSYRYALSILITLLKCAVDFTVTLRVCAVKQNLYKYVR